MTEGHADRLSERLREHFEAFEQAERAADWGRARRAWLLLMGGVDTVIRESRAARMEADTLACELSVYRPTRAERPAAPMLPGHAYVFTGKSPWVCAAVELRTVVLVPTLGIGYDQEHYTTERKTVCGKAVSYPVTERFTSGGWPRLHELCPDCTKAMIGKTPSLFTVQTNKVTA